MKATTKIPALRQLRRRARRLQALQGFGRVSATCIAVVLVLFGLDRVLDLPTIPRWLLDLACSGLILHSFWKHLWEPLRTPFTARALAATLEKSHPELRGLLATWVELPAAPRGTSEALLAAACEQARELSQNLSPRTALPSHKPWRWASLGLLSLFGFMTLAMQVPEDNSIFWARRFGGSALWPRATRLRLLPPQTEDTAGLALTQTDAEHWRGLATLGSRVLVRIQAEGEVPEFVQCIGIPGTPHLRSVGGGEFLLRLPPLREALTLNFKGGDDLDGTPELQLQPVQAPIPQQWTVFLKYPDYLDREPETSEQFEFHVPEHTQMQVRFQSKATRFAETISLDGLRQELTSDAEGWFQFSASAIGAGELALSLRNQEGFTASRAAVLRWSTVRDRAPELGFAWPPQSWSTVAGASLPVRMTASDDHGLAYASLSSFDESTLSLSIQDKRSNAWFELLAIPEDWTVPSHVRLHLSAEDLAIPESHSRKVDSPRIQVFDAPGFEQQQRQDLSRMRTEIESLLTRVQRLLEDSSGIANPSATATRVARGLQRLESSFSVLLVERVFALDEVGNDRVRSAFVERLRTQAPEAANFSAIFQRQMGVGRSAGLAELTRTAGELHRGPALALREATLRGQDVAPPATALVDGLQGMLDALLTWEDFEAAIELLRGVLERQRALHWRTLEAARE